jgi:ribose 5-phosphate isomerase A
MTSGRASMLEAERVARAHASSGEPLVTDSGNGILDCDFGRIAEPARLDKRIWRIVGVVESGLFISRVLRGRCGRRPPLRQRARPSGQSADPGAHGRVGGWKSTIAEELSARLGWPFEEGDSLHPESNVVKMHAGMPLTDADRLPWLERVAAWIDGQRAKKQPGIITSEDPLTVDAGAPAAHVANEIIRLLGASATVVQGVPARRLT